MDQNNQKGLNQIWKLLSEIANPAFKLPVFMQQHIFQVFRVIIDEIESFKLERDKKVVLFRYKMIKTELLKLSNNLTEFHSRANLARKELFESIRREIDEIFIFLKMTRDMCLQF